MVLNMIGGTMNWADLTIELFQIGILSIVYLVMAYVLFKRGLSLKGEGLFENSIYRITYGSIAGIILGTALAVWDITRLLFTNEVPVYLALGVMLGYTLSTVEKIAGPTARSALIVTTIVAVIVISLIIDLVLGMFRHYHELNLNLFLGAFIGVIVMWITMWITEIKLDNIIVSKADAMYKKGRCLVNSGYSDNKGIEYLNQALYLLDAYDDNSYINERLANNIKLTLGRLKSNKINC